LGPLAALRSGADDVVRRFTETSSVRTISRSQESRCRFEVPARGQSRMSILVQQQPLTCFLRADLLIIAAVIVVGTTGSADFARNQLKQTSEDIPTVSSVT
jgi:hypothetical protein